MEGDSFLACVIVGFCIFIHVWFCSFVLFLSLYTFVFLCCLFVLLYDVCKYLCLYVT